LGIPVAKHGNRSVSSVSGSSDLLSALGYSLEKSHEGVESEFLEKKFAFLFAPMWHPAMKYAGNVRKELGMRTFFNLIGPLSNPFSPTHQIIGVFSKDWIGKLGFALAELGIQKGIVCHSRDGFDEFSIFAPTDYLFIQQGKKEERVFDPSSLGLKETNPEEVYISSPEKAVEESRRILGGADTSGTDLVSLNAGAALWLMDKADSIESGFHIAKNQILNKKVAQFSREILLLK
jgi:anthranilate phosphoribosyltransferase